VIVQVFVREWSLDILRLLKSIKSLPFVTDVLINRGSTNQVVADSVKVWDEGDLHNPEDLLFELALVLKLSQLLNFASS
jgi:hypothetical protein